MIRLIFNVIFLIVIAIFIAWNIPYATTINLFGRVLEEVSIIVVIILSLVAGVLYSLIFYLISHVSSIDRERLRERLVITKQKEKDLDNREKYIQHVIENRKTPPQSQNEQVPEALKLIESNIPVPVKKRRFSLFKRKP